MTADEHTVMVRGRLWRSVQAISLSNPLRQHFIGPTHDVSTLSVQPGMTEVRASPATVLRGSRN